MKSLPLPELPKNAARSGLKAYVDEIVRFSFGFHENSPEFHKEAVQLRHADKTVGRILDEWDEALRGVIANLLGSLGVLTRLKDPEAASCVIIRTLEDNIHSFRLSRLPVGKERLINELTDILFMYVFG